MVGRIPSSIVAFNRSRAVKQLLHIPGIQVSVDSHLHIRIGKLDDEAVRQDKQGNEGQQHAPRSPTFGIYTLLPLGINPSQKSDKRNDRANPKHRLPKINRHWHQQRKDVSKTGEERQRHHKQRIQHIDYQDRDQLYPRIQLSHLSLLRVEPIYISAVAWVFIDQLGTALFHDFRTDFCIFDNGIQGTAGQAVGHPR